MRCVTKAGEQDFNVSGNSVLASKLPETILAVAVDRQCPMSKIEDSNPFKTLYARPRILSRTKLILTHPWRRYSYKCQHG